MTDVLNHGFVKLVDSMPSHVFETGDETWGLGDARIVQAARVSYTKRETTVEQDKRLLAYLLEHDHGSPFEKVVFEFHVKLPIFVARQLVKYRAGTSINEISGRYAKLPTEFYVPELDRMQAQAKDNKQCSGALLPSLDAVACQADIRIASEEAFRTYEGLLRMGLSREIARSVLPLGTYTEWFWTMNLRSLMHIVSQRVHPGAQWETEQYARALAKLAMTVCPFAMGKKFPGMAL